MPKYIPGSGPSNPDLMILLDCPSADDVNNGRLLTGSGGKETIKCLREAGISPDSCWISSVIKYHVPESDKKIPIGVRAERLGINVQEQLENLQNEINSIKPNCILTLGGDALYHTTGKKNIKNYRGSILAGSGTKIVGTYKPSDLNKFKGSEFVGYWNRPIILFDMKRALRESKRVGIVRPSRNLQVCRNSAQLADFVKRNRDAKRVSIDIEALNCIPTCIGLACNNFEGISIPLWNTRGISTIPDSDLVSMWILISDFLASRMAIGQNFKYDEDKIRRLGFTIRGLASDTMLKAFAINPELPKSLAFNTSIYTDEPYYKDEGADFDPSKQNIDDLFLYNARDAVVTYEIDQNMDSDLDELGMRDYYENFIMKLHPLYLDIEARGFCVNTVTRDRLIEKYISWDERLRYELFKELGCEVNTNSSKQMSSLLYDTLKLPWKKGTGEEVLTTFIQNKSVPSEKKKVLELILEQRRVKKSISTYLMALPDFDGKMKTTYFLCLETGRTSTGQQDPPIRPTVEVTNEHGKKKKKVLGTAFQTITKHGDIGQDIRSMYEPSPGYIFLQADSSQAEARVVFLLADDEQALKDIDEHDYHALTASWFFGGSESDYSKRVLGYESPIRFAGKTLRHAGHLGAGDKRAATELNTQARKYHIPITINQALAGRALKIFHQKQPKIQGVFHKGIIDEITKTRKLRAPVPYGISAKQGGVRTFYERYGDELFRQALSYIPQRSVTDNTKAAAIRISSRIKDIRIILEAHDALLFEIREDLVEDYGEVIKEEMERELIFDNCSLSRRNLSIPCDLEVGENYMEFRKFKGRVRA